MIEIIVIFATVSAIIIIVVGLVSLGGHVEELANFVDDLGSADFASPPSREADGNSIIIGYEVASTIDPSLRDIEMEIQKLSHTFIPSIAFHGTYDASADNDFRSQISYRGEAHILTIGATRSGKGVGAIIPNLLTYRGSVVVIDPKGESVKETAARRRALGSKVYILDPWGECDTQSSRYNPFDLYSRFSNDLIDEARLLADSLVVQSNSDTQKYWEEEARNVISTLILYLIDRDGSFKPTELRRLLSLSKADLIDLIDSDLLNRTSFGGVIARGATQLAEKSNAEFASVMSSVRQNCTVLDSEAVSASMDSSDFQFSSLKNEPITVYIVIPVHKIASNIRWLRLIVSSAISEFQRNNRGPSDVLFIIDEFAGLGKLDSVTNSFAYMAGYGVKLWPIVQDLSQLQSAYPNLWQTIVANAGVLQYFGTRDLLTASYISELCGVKTVQVDDDTSGASGNSRTRRTVQRPVMFPHEVINLDPAYGIAFLNKSGPIRFEKIKYYSDQYFISLNVGEIIH